MSVKLAVIYYSSYGTNHTMAEIAVEAARAAGAEVRLRKAPETVPMDIIAGVDVWKAHTEATAKVIAASIDDLKWANTYLFSAPTRFGVQASQIRAFIDSLGGFWAEGGFAGKAVSAMTSAQNTHGGQEQTLMSFYATAMHWGSIIVAPGYTDPAIYATGGNPYGYSHTMGADFDDKAVASISHQARRLVEVAARLLA